MTTSDDTTETLLTVQEAMQRLKIGRTYLYKLIGDGDLHTVRLGRSVRIREAELDGYIRSLQASA